MSYFPCLCREPSPTLCRPKWLIKCRLAAALLCRLEAGSSTPRLWFVCMTTRRLTRQSSSQMCSTKACRIARAAVFVEMDCGLLSLYAWRCLQSRFAFRTETGEREHHPVERGLGSRVDFATKRRKDMASTQEKARTNTVEFAERDRYKEHPIRRKESP